MNISLSDHFSFKRLLRFVFPTIIMMIVTSIYSIVDGFFVSNFVGKNSFAAVNLIMPVLMALGSFGFMIGTGGTALVSRTLGMKRERQANEIFTFLVCTIAIVGIVLSIVGFVLMPKIAIWLGASNIIIDDCILYGRILIIANTFFMLQNSFQSFLITAEKPHMGLVISIAAGLTNIILDFLFVYILDWGIWGAAVATSLSQFIGGIVPLIYFSRKNSSRLRFVKFKVDMRVFGQTCLNGSSEMLTNLSVSFVSILYNFQLAKLAAEDGIAAYGVIMYVTFIFMAFYFGYSIGVAPLIGYNYGSDNRIEMRNIFKKSIVINGIASVIMTLSGVFLSHPLSKLFVGYDSELLSMTSNGMRLFSLSFLLCGFNIFGSAFFTALSNGLLSALISFLRTFVFQILAVLLLPVILGIDGIWLAVVFAETFTIIVTIVILYKNKKRYHYM